TLFGVIDLRDDLNLYYLVMALFAIGFFIIWRTVNSPFGQVLKALRENEPRALSLGYDVDRFKLMAFVLSAAIAGLAGSAKTLVGSILGAFMVVLLENKVGGFGRFMAELTGNSWFLRLGESVTIVIGLIFIICVLAFRRGIVGEWQAYLARRRARPQAGAA